MESDHQVRLGILNLKILFILMFNYMIFKILLQLYLKTTCLKWVYICSSKPNNVSTCKID